MEYKKVSEILICPICQDISVPPIYQCGNGHIICKRCLTLLKDALCPTCRTQLPAEKIRALALEQLANTIDVKCKHWSKGCTTTYGLKEINAHVQKCIYEGIDLCRQFGSKCRDHLPLVDFKEHCQTIHANSCLIVDDIVKCDIEQSIILGDLVSSSMEDSSSQIVWEPCYIIKGKIIYVITSKYELSQKLFQFGVILISSEVWNKSLPLNKVEITTQLMDEDLGDFQSKTIWFGKCLNFSQNDVTPNKTANCSIPLCFFAGSSKPTEIDMDNLIKWRLSVVISSLSGEMVKSKNDQKVSAPSKPPLKPSIHIKPQIGGVGKMSPAIAKMIQEYGTNNNASNLPVEQTQKLDVNMSKMSVTSTPKDLIESHAYRKINGEGSAHKEIFTKKCVACEVSPITGTLFTCSDCSDIYLCDACTRKGKHDQHPLIRIKYRELRAFKYVQEEQEIDVEAVVRHGEVQCDSCGMSPILGIRYKCCCCLDLDFCEKCHDKGFHNFHWCIRSAKFNEIAVISAIAKLPDNSLRNFHQVALARGYTLSNL